MIKIRKSEDRGHFDHGWLNTYHTFSFGDYQDEKHMGFRTLRVINEDIVKPSEGFPTHGHRDMEIITYILDGALEHKDSMGNTSVIKPGDAQRMSAGTGVRHSEFNGNKDIEVHLLQIWIIPASKGDQPSYEQKHFPKEDRSNLLRLIGSPTSDNGSIKINQDVKLYSCLLDGLKSVTYTIPPGRGVWIQLAHGSIHVNGQNMTAGDGAAIEKESSIEIKAEIDSEFLLFDLA